MIVLVVSLSQFQKLIESNRAMESIDESLYSRQLLVLGERAMNSMASSRVFLSGLGGLGEDFQDFAVVTS